MSAQAAREVQPVRFSQEPVRHSMETPAGEAWTWAYPGALESGRPLVLMIAGFYAIARHRGFELQDLLPEAAVLHGHLPGNHCPQPRRHSVEDYAALYDGVLDRIGRPTVVIGNSVGALTALSMRSPQVKGLVLLEPPLVTAKLWPLIEPFQKQLRERPKDAVLRDMMWNIFGYTADAATGRDYRPLVEALAVPSWALIGGEALMPRRTAPEMPSLVDTPERELLQAHPLISVQEIQGVGHGVSGRAITFVRSRTRDLMSRTIAADAAGKAG